MGRVEHGVLPLPFPVTGQLERLPHHGQAIRTVPDHLTGGGGLAVFEQVDAPQFDRVHAERPRDDVHVTLAREL